MTRQTSEKTWDPCRDFLSPLMADFAEVAKTDNPSKYPLQRLMEAYRLAWWNRGLEWLRQKFGVEYAKDFEAIGNKLRELAGNWWKRASEEQSILEWQDRLDRLRVMRDDAKQKPERRKAAEAALKELVHCAPMSLLDRQEDLNPATGFSYSLMLDWPNVMQSAEVARRRIGDLLQVLENEKTHAKAGAGGRRKERRRTAHREERPLAAKQTEALHIVGECKGNYAFAARQLGGDPKTVRQHCEAAMRKMGKQVSKSKTRRLPQDRRGQVTV